MPSDHILRYQGPLLTVHTWEQPLGDGSSTTYERCIRPDSASVLAFLDKDTILLIRERRFDREVPFIDIPGGRVDPGETHEAAIKRELYEETSYQASSWLLWDEEDWGGLVTFRSSLFLAKGLTFTRPASIIHDPSEQIEVLPMSLKEAAEFCLKQNLRRTQATLAILRLAYDPAARARLDTFLNT